MHLAKEFIVHTCPPLASLQCSLTTHVETQSVDGDAAAVMSEFSFTDFLLSSHCRTGSLMYQFFII